MKRQRSWLTLGCGGLFAVSIIVIFFAFSVVQENERKNELAGKQFERLCKKDSLLDRDNRQRWHALERNVESGAVDSRDLRIQIPLYEGPADRYQDIMGPLKPAGQSGRLFRRDILVFKDSKEIVRISDIVAIKENIISIYALPFASRSCYNELMDFDRVINRHHN
ncbi:MAG: hypothetical protein ACKO96_41805 [Flammeovirgaceae bacterium]